MIKLADLTAGQTIKHFAGPATVAAVTALTPSLVEVELTNGLAVIGAPGDTAHLAG